MVVSKSTRLTIICCISLFYILGKAREKLKWADGKAIKAEIDMQVRHSQYKTRNRENLHMVKINSKSGYRSLAHS